MDNCVADYTRRIESEGDQQYFYCIHFPENPPATVLIMKNLTNRWYINYISGKHNSEILEAVRFKTQSWLIDGIVNNLYLDLV